MTTLLRCINGCGYVSKRKTVELTFTGNPGVAHEEFVDGNYCDRCGAKTRMRKTDYISHLDDYVVLTHTGSRAEWKVPPMTFGRLAELVHTGSHYYANVYVGGQVFQANDSSVSQIAAPPDDASTPYMVLYGKLRR